ncbi:carbonic anhydrase [Rhodococcus qingshengii]|uniref:carbonic anhydrase n=1 Tax=Rhodococcus qingshengii TaxID=334542 RepID=UPI002034C7F4
MAKATLAPADAWEQLRSGNERFVAGQPHHPSQSVSDRERLAHGQRPKAVIFGCADSRVAAEIIFDQGLGDVFVVRTAGHVMDSAVLGSLEYAIRILNVPLIRHPRADSCGAVGAALQAIDGLHVPGGHIRDVVERVTPSILLGRSEGLSTVDEFEARHVQETSRRMMERSSIIASAVADGDTAIVGLTYQLADGHMHLHAVVGAIE